MKIPQKVRITARVAYEVCYLDDPDTSLCGYCCEEKKQIFLNLNQSDTEMIKTLIHEVIHAVESEYKITVTHKAVGQLETAFYKLLKLNKLI